MLILLDLQDLTYLDLFCKNAGAIEDYALLHYFTEIF